MPAERFPKRVKATFRTAVEVHDYLRSFGCPERLAVAGGAAWEIRARESRGEISAAESRSLQAAVVASTKKPAGRTDADRRAYASSLAAQVAEDRAAEDEDTNESDNELQFDCPSCGNEEGNDLSYSEDDGGILRMKCYRCARQWSVPARDHMSEEEVSACRTSPERRREIIQSIRHAHSARMAEQAKLPASLRGK